MDSGGESPKLLATFDPDGSCWRTLQLSLLSEDPPLLERLPEWGTASDGGLYELPMLGPATAAPDGSALLKTPTSNLGANGGSQHPDKRKVGGHGPTLADEIEHLLPTPSMSTGPGRQGRQGGMNLQTAVATL